MDDMPENAWCEKDPSLPHLNESRDNIQIVLRRQDLSSLFAIGA